MSEMTLRQQRERQESLRKMAEEQAQPINNAVAELNANMIALRKEQTSVVKQFWSLSLATIADALGARDRAGNLIGLDTARLDQTGKLYQAGAIDEVTAYPVTENRSKGAEVAAYKAFLVRLTAGQGFTLGKAGLDRLGTYAEIQAIMGADFTQQQSWDMAFERLMSLGCFADGEFGFDESLITVFKPAPVAEPVVEKPFDLEATDLSSRAGEKAAKEFVHERFGDDVAVIYQEWKSSLESNFAFFLTPAVGKKVLQYFEANNLNMLDRRSYDRARKWCVRQGLMPESCLTPADVIEAKVEASDMSSLESKRHFQQESRQVYGY